MFILVTRIFQSFMLSLFVFCCYACYSLDCDDLEQDVDLSYLNVIRAASCQYYMLGDMFFSIIIFSHIYLNDVSEIYKWEIRTTYYIGFYLENWGRITIYLSSDILWISGYFIIVFFMIIWFIDANSIYPFVVWIRFHTSLFQRRYGQGQVTNCSTWTS